MSLTLNKKKAKVFATLKKLLSKISFLKIVSPIAKKEILKAFWQSYMTKVGCLFILNYVVVVAGGVVMATR